MLRVICRLKSLSLKLNKLFVMPKSAEQWFYAVKRGKTPGIFLKWSDCEAQVKGFTSASYKKFSSVTEAAEFITGNPVESKRAHSTSPDKEVAEPKKKKPNETENNFTGTPFEDEKAVHVYTDGGCFFNGMAGAQAGIGVFWGQDDPDNVSDKLAGRPSNNRAEIHAAVKAVEIAKRKGIQNLILHTDSQFLINGITKWITGWKKRDWKLSTGGPVINKEDFVELDEQLQGINVKWVYVKGHSGDKGNEAVDALAKKGASKKSDESNEK